MDFVLVDLPGTYSLMANSVEEEIARDFICFGKPDVTVVVTDATCLERNLNLVIQILEITEKVIVCVNLLDEAKGKINVEIKELSQSLCSGCGTNARDGEGLQELKDAILNMISGKIKSNPIKIDYDDDIKEAVKIFEPVLNKIIGNKLNNRWTVLRLIDGDETIKESINNYLGLNLSDDIELISLYDRLEEYLAEKY